VEFQVSVADMRDGAHPAEIDCVVSAAPGHRVGDLLRALEPLLPRRSWAAPARGVGPVSAAGGTATGARWAGQPGPGQPRPGPGPGQPGASTGGTGPAKTPNWGGWGGKGGTVHGGPDGTGASGGWTGWGAGRAAGTAAPGGHAGPVTAAGSSGTVTRGAAAALAGFEGAQLWLDGRALDAGTTLAASGIRAGARLGLGGPAPGPGQPGRWAGGGTGGVPWGAATSGAAASVSLRPDPGDPFFLLVNKHLRAAPAMPSPVVVNGAAPPDAGAREPTPWLNLLLGPAISMAVGVVTAVLYSPVFLLLGLGGTVATLLPQLLNMRKGKTRARQQAEQVAKAAATLRERIAAAVAAEERLLNDALPGPDAVIETVTGTGPRLWERSAGDDDFLRIRLGTGDQPARTVIVQGAGPAPAQASDPWAALAGTPGLATASLAAVNAGADAGDAKNVTISETPMVRNVPAAVDLPRLGVVGIAGPPSVGRDVLAWTVAQLTAAHGPGELRLFLLTDAPQAWRWTGWLPHLRPLGDRDGWLSVGTDRATRARRIAELRDLVAQRRTAAAGAPAGGPGTGGYPGAGPGGEGFSPAVVVIIDGYAAVRDTDGINDVLAGGPGVGVFAVCRDDHRRELPAACTALLEPDQQTGQSGTYWQRGKAGAEQLSGLDRLRDWRADEFGRALAPLRDRAAEQQAQAAAVVRLGELWGYDQVSPVVLEELWHRRGGSTRVPLGRLADGSPFRLDIAQDGPHMLVGGTTGSGKSEFLQTFVASLAHASPPDALNFVLIDYKGGAAFAGCSGLPHVTGFLRNLDEHLGRRVMLAVKAETQYRQWLLAEAQCPDIESYWAAGSPKGPLPRLLVVVDEFARLAQEMPEILTEMTKVTVIGRTIGVHLVLATQRPAGVVNADIQANTALRLALRVEDPQDSTAVIGIQDAAMISKQAKGHGYARTERTAVTEFQGAYVGAPATGTAAGHAAGAALRLSARTFETAGTPALLRDSGALNIPRSALSSQLTGPTDLSELVNAVLATGRQAPPRKAWLDPLPPQIPLAALPAAPAAAGTQLPPVGYGMEDRPARQEQAPLAFDLEHGTHLLVGGGAQSGRTTLLRALAVQLADRCSPADVHLYVLDCDAGGLVSLERLPHCGAVVQRTEADRAGRLLDRLDAEVARRKEALSGAGFSSVTEQRRVAPADERLPYLVLLLDLWEAFSADLGQTDMQRLSTVLSRLISEGAAAGLRVVVTGGLAALGKLSSAIPERIVLRLNNVSDSHAAGVPRGVLPPDPGPGRGVLLPGANEVQLAFAGQDPSGTGQAAAVEEVIGRASQRYPAPVPAPIRVDPMPASVSLARASALPGWPGPALRPGLGIGGDELGWYGPDLERYPGFAIAGPPYSGRSTALVVLATSLLRAGTSVIGIAPRESPLRALDGRDGVLAVFREANVDQRKLYELLEGASGPVVVFVDDVEEVVGTPADALLSQVPREGRGRGQALVIAGAPADLVRGSRSLTATARSYNCGLLLTPDDTQMASQLLGLRLTRSALFSRPAGRGYLAQPGQPVLIQVPEATAP
jgi:DNA segregation ATPase FtsK/SpoIIIE, S-DNA-T family